MTSIRLADGEAPTISSGERARFGKVEDNTMKLRIVLAGGDGQVAGRAAEIDQAMKPAQIEGGHDPGRAQ